MTLLLARILFGIPRRREREIVRRRDWEICLVPDVNDTLHIEEKWIFNFSYYILRRRTYDV